MRLGIDEMKSDPFKVLRRNATFACFRSSMVLDLVALESSLNFLSRIGIEHVNRKRRLMFVQLYDLGSRLMQGWNFFFSLWPLQPRATMLHTQPRPLHLLACTMAFLYMCAVLRMGSVLWPGQIPVANFSCPSG